MQKLTHYPYGFMHSVSGQRAREVEWRDHADGAHGELAHNGREALVALRVVHGRPLACAQPVRYT